MNSGQPASAAYFYILYIKPDHESSIRAMRLVPRGSKIAVQDVNKLTYTPQWLTGVPFLVKPSTGEMFPGAACLQTLQKYVEMLGRHMVLEFTAFDAPLVAPLLPRGSDPAGYPVVQPMNVTPQSRPLQPPQQATIAQQPPQQVQTAVTYAQPQPQQPDNLNKSVQPLGTPPSQPVQPVQQPQPPKPKSNPNVIQGLPPPNIDPNQPNTLTTQQIELPPHRPTFEPVVPPPAAQPAQQPATTPPAPLQPTRQVPVPAPKRPPPPILSIPRPQPVSSNTMQIPQMPANAAQA